MKILIAGSHGMIGSAVTCHLIECGHEVIRLVRREPGLGGLLSTLTWVYLVVSVFLYVGVMIFIGTEEKQLTQVFGKEYEQYLASVDRLIPLKKP